jgi:hypothetical protein
MSDLSANQNPSHPLLSLKIPSAIHSPFNTNPMDMPPIMEHPTDTHNCHIALLETIASIPLPRIINSSKLPMKLRIGQQTGLPPPCVIIVHGSDSESSNSNDSPTPTTRERNVPKNKKNNHQPLNSLTKKSSPKISSTTRNNA